jgi:hypothetical protein
MGASCSHDVQRRPLPKAIITIVSLGLLGLRPGNGIVGGGASNHHSRHQSWDNMPSSCACGSPATLA